MASPGHVKQQWIRQRSFTTLCLTAIISAFLLSLYTLRPVMNTKRVWSSSINQSRHDKWIVVTTIAHPTDDVKYLASIPGWKVVVVGDTRTPSNWSFPNCDFLSIEQQEALGFQLTTRLPYGSYSRKNVGYLYAIARGAKVIYETDDDNHPFDRLSSFHSAATTHGMLYTGHNTVFNPYKHFGQSTLWPRGFPLSAVGQKQEQVYRISSRWPTPLIQQGLVNGDPDMDAIFRLTRKQTLQKLDVRFDPVAPPVFLPEGVFSPFNAQNTLFLHGAFWAMFLPTTTTFRMCDIWRSYWAQRLLWEIGGRLGFYPPNAYQLRNAHSLMEDAEGERLMYYNTERLITFLTSWQCQVKFSFFQCIQKLTSDMAVNEFWKSEDVNIVHLWLEDLLSLGYPQPSRVCTSCTFKYESRPEPFYQGEYDQCDSFGHSVPIVPNGVPVAYAAAEQMPPMIHTGFLRNTSTSVRQMENFLTICPGITLESMKATTNTFFHDILLIVVYNWPFFENTYFLDALYRPRFPNIVYCGTNATDFQSQTVNISTELTFIQVPLHRGYFGYMCTTVAMEMGYNVTGYLVVGDDDLINTWNFLSLNKSQIWRYNRYRPFVDKIKDMDLPSSHRFKTELLKAMHELFKETQTVPSDVRPLQEFKKQLYQNTNGILAAHGVGDIFYIPQTYERHFRFYISFFCKHRVHLEVAIPAVFFGLADAQNDMQLFYGSLLYREDKQHPLSRFDSEQHFLHPVKLTVFRNRDDICSIYANKLLEKLSLVPQS